MWQLWHNKREKQHSTWNWETYIQNLVLSLPSFVISEPQFAQFIWTSTFSDNQGVALYREEDTGFRVPVLDVLLISCMI